MLEISFYDEIIRVFFSLIAGLLIGYTRRSYPAGTRTFILICLGSTIFAIISIDPSIFGTTNYDPSRIISQIVTGIGFIGAGVIWKSNARIGGLTTAAAIWTTSAIGILIGIGDYMLSLITLIIVMGVLYSKNITRKKGLRQY